MSTRTTGIAATTLDNAPAEDRVSVAALHLYEADSALHIARQSGVGAWIAVAYDRLHEAVLEHDAALAERATPPDQQPAGRRRRGRTQRCRLPAVATG